MNDLLTERKMMEKEFPSPPDQKWFDDHVMPESWLLIKGRLQDKIVLDIGCASGWVGYYAQKEGATVICTDIFGTHVKPGLDFMIADKENLPFRNGWFDFVLTSNVLHHGDLLKTCTEAHRVLKPGGEFISFIEPCIPESSNEEEYLKTHCEKELELGIVEHRPNLETYKNALMVFSKVQFYPEVPSNYEGAIGIRAIK